LAIAWVLRRPEVTGAIVGARRPRQIETTATAAGWSLSSDEIAEIDVLLTQHRDSIGQLSWEYSQIDVVGPD
jgi:aryl-alcohol dehydrogenase-like predicted oxidoreductase